MSGSDVGLSVWPITGITKKVLKYCLNRVVDFAKASTILIVEKFAMESLKNKTIKKKEKKIH